MVDIGTTDLSVFSFRNVNEQSLHFNISGFELASIPERHPQIMDARQALTTTRIQAKYLIKRPSTCTTLSFLKGII